MCGRKVASVRSDSLLPMDSSPPGSSPWDSTGKYTGVGCHFLFQGTFPTQGSNHCLFYPLHWQAGFFFFFTTSATWEALGSVNTGVYDHEPLMVLIKLLEFRELQKTCSLNLTTPGVQEKEKILWKGIHAAHTHLGQNLGPGRLSVRPPNELSTCRTKL